MTRDSIIALPQGVDVDHRKRPITLGGNNDSLNDAAIVDELVCIKKLLPPAAPAIAIVPAPN